MLRRTFKNGDIVVYRKAKWTTRPGRRARVVHAATKGDYYSYFVEKFWLVDEVRDDGTLLLVTRRGKTHVVDQTDPNLRHTTWLDRILHRSRIAALVDRAEQGPVYS